MDWWLFTFFIGAILSLFLPIVPALFQLFLLLLLAIVFFGHQRLQTSSGLLFGGVWVLFNALSYQQQIPSDLGRLMSDRKAFVIEGQVLTLTNMKNEMQSGNHSMLNGGLSKPLKKQQIPLEKTHSKSSKKTQSKVKFNFKVTRVADQVLTDTLLIRLNWNKPPIRIGQGQWLRVNVKLKPAHGMANLGGFNYLAWLKSNNIAATGYVINDGKGVKNNSLIAEKLSLRQRLFNQYQFLFSYDTQQQPSLKPLMFALAFGSRSQLTPEHWQVLQATGTGHLIAISGLHIGLVASSGYIILMMLIRFLPLGWSLQGRLTRISQCLQQSNSHYLAILSSMTVAVSYGFLAGFSLPTQRALVMLTIYWLTRLLAIKLSIKRWFLLTLFILVLISPFSLFTASFWLSVYAVSFIFMTLWRFRFYLNQGSGLLRFFKGLLLIQLSLTLMLLPISALFFQKLSMIAFFANILAVPWMSFISIPCALLSVFLMPFNSVLAQFFLQISLQSLTLLWSYLTFLADLPFAQQVISQRQHQLLIFIICLVISVVFLSPSLSPPKSFIYLVLRLRAELKFFLLWGLLILLVYILFLVVPNSHFLPLERRIKDPILYSPWQLHLFDVGQGLSVLISRNEKSLLYDTGAAYPSGFNMVDSVILPYLNYAGINQLDKVFLSHSDNDHAGGLMPLIEGVPIKQLITNDPELASKHQQVITCYQGMTFNWQDLYILALWPPASDKKSVSHVNKHSKKKVKPGNDESCVLLISDGRHKVLLTGDISKKVEKSLLLLYPQLKVDVLVVPHHGSKTSSNQAFIKQIAPRVALVSAGFMNRWAMPVNTVVARYQQQDIKLINTSDKGQIVLSFKDDIYIESYHDDFRPFWFSH